MSEEPKNKVVASPPKTSTETLEMFLAQLDGSNSSQFQLNDEHIHKFLDQRGKIIDKVHEDRRGKRYDKKFVLVVFLIFYLLVLGGVAYLQPNFFTEVVIALISGTGGAGMGYAAGLAKNQD